MGVGVEDCHSGGAGLEQPHGCAGDAGGAGWRGLEIVPCASSAEVFERVVGGEADGAVLPIENSLHGSVAEHYDLLLAQPVRDCAGEPAARPAQPDRAARGEAGRGASARCRIRWRCRSAGDGWRRTRRSRR